MLNLIKSKKIDSRIVTAVLYAAFCFAYFVPARGTVALLAINYSLPAFFNNDIAAFFVAGIFPTLVYEIISSVSFRFLQRYGGVRSEDMRYSLRFFYIPAALLAGGVKLVFMFFPLGGVFANILVDPIAAMIFFVLFMWFALKNYVDKMLYARFIYSLGGIFVIVYGLLAVMGLVAGVM